MNIFNTVWEWVKAQLLKVSKADYCRFIFGLILGALFSISFHWNACFAPVVMIEMIAMGVTLYRTRTFSWRPLLVAGSGSLLIFILSLI